MASLWSLVRGKSTHELWDSAKFSVIKDVDITRNEIGRGSFGVVYGAVYGGRQCVAKEIHHSLVGGGVNNNTVLQSFIKEINILSTLRHSNIVYFFGVHFREESHVPVLIIERMWMSLAKLLEEKPTIPLFIKVHILHDVACGLKFLHSQDPPVMHRDLTANNILVSKNMDAKITDLGLATAFEAISKQRLSTAPGNLAHMPPEALQHDPIYSPRLDIFSFGCVSLHIVTQQFPTPTDQFESSQICRDEYIKVSELRRRKAYTDAMQESCPQLFHIVQWCLRDEPAYRPDANQLCEAIETYQERPEIKQNCTEMVIEYCRKDKFSLVIALNEQCTKAEDLDSTVKMYQTQVQELTNTAVSKDEHISLLEKHNEDLQMSLQSQQAENARLRSQTEKFQHDLSQNSDNQIIMSLNTMLRQDQEDMKEKQEEIKELKMKLNNLEQLSTRMRREGERKEQELQEGSTQLQALQRKEAELAKNIEAINNEKGHLMHEKEGLEQRVKEYSTNLRKKEDEIKDLKAKLEKVDRNNESSESENLKKQPKEASDDDQLNKIASNEFAHEKFQRAAHDVPTNANEMHNKMEELKLKLKNEEEKHVKLMKEMEWKMQKQAKDLELKLKSQEEMFKNEAAQKEAKFKREVLGTEAAHWKAEAGQERPSADKDLEAKLLAEKRNLEQEKEKLKQQSLAAHKMNTAHLTEFNNRMKEMQAANESRMQNEKLKLQYLETLKQQEKQFAKLKQDYANAKSSFKQQSSEKSLRLSLLESQLNSAKQKLDTKDKDLSGVLEEKENIQKLLENMSKLHTSEQEELKAYKEAHKKEGDVLEKVTKENVDEVLQAELSECQHKIKEKEKEIALLKETLQTYLDCHSTDQDKIKQLEKQVKDYGKSQAKLERQYETKVKQNSQYIEKLEKKSFSEYSSHYCYSVSWSPYIPLPVKSIRSSSAIVRDKVFVTGGYHQLNPQGEEMKMFLKSLQGKNEVYCFPIAKCRCDTIASPVLLGALASVNDQCVLVSGVDSVGNTLTGNVYVLCEEGSHDQWKEFSKPLPTPRILPCACCYGNRWLIVCGGFATKPKEDSGLLEAVSVVEILDATKGEWHALPKRNCPNISTILCCAVVGEDVYVVGSDQVIKTSCNKLIKAASTTNNILVWDEVQVGEAEESSEKIYPFSVVEVNGEPMIIASMTDGEDDVTCVVMKDTTGRWRIMSKAVECQHRSAAVVTSSLELLLFGGSEKILVEEATEICQNGTLIPTLDDVSRKDDKLTSKQINASENEIVVPNQPACLSFTGPIHTIQFDHKGGTFQSPIHKVSLVVPPNALSDGEKVTVYMGATTSGPFDFPEDCKLRSAVVWLSGSGNITFKKSIALVLPHSAMLSNPEYHPLMKFLICEECEGSKYHFKHSQVQFEIGEEYALIKLEQFTTMMVAVVSEAKPVVVNGSTKDHGEEDMEIAIPTRYLAKLFWPPKHLPASFRVDIFCIQNVPTELYKVDVLYKKSYFKEHGVYPEVSEVEFTMCGNHPLKCILPCDNSNDCKCLADWDVTQLTESIAVNTEAVNSQMNLTKFSFKLNCHHPGAHLKCCFELQGAKREGHSKLEYIPQCLKARFSEVGNFPPILLGSGKNSIQDAARNGDTMHGTK